MKNYIKRVLSVLKKRLNHHKMIVGDNFSMGIYAVIFHNGPKENIKIGRCVSILGKLNVRSGGILVVGDYSTIRYDSEIDVVSSVTIGRNCIISNNVIVSDNNSHPTSPEKRRIMCESGHESELWDRIHSKSKPVIIEDNVWIGRRVMINKGVRIGEGSIIAAGAVVTKSVPPYSVVYGNPARHKPLEW